METTKTCIDCGNEPRLPKRRVGKTCHYKRRKATVERWRSEQDPDRIRKYQRDSRRKRHAEERERALEKLGRECQACGFDDLRALQFDHVNGGGGKERSMLDRIKMFKAVADGTRTDIQLLCANCHAIKTYEDAHRSPASIGVL